MNDNKPTVNDIIRAKEIAKRNGYEVTLPDSKVEIAKNIATAAGYKVQEPGDIAKALDVATKAGYTVSRKADTKPTTVVPQQDTSTTKGAAPEKSQEDINYDNYLKAAASYL